MKFSKIIFLSAIIILIVTSCVKDLDPKSLGPNVSTSVDIYKTPEDFKKGLAKLYGSYALAGQDLPGNAGDIQSSDVGFTVYLREYWYLQVLTTDEAVYTWSEAGSAYPLHWQTWTATNPFVQFMFTRMMLTISFCNEFIRASSGSSDANVKKFNAEARFLRALSYYHALDMFGYPPFVTEADKPGAFNPKQTNPNDLFVYIDSELSAIENELGDPGFEYGRADKAALWMLQGKLYLNAQTYIQTNKYTECIAAMNKIFASNKYALATNYLLNFRADNNTSPEIIFPITFDANNTQSYGGTDFIIFGEIGGSMNMTDFGVNGAWNSVRTTPQFVGKFSDPSGATDKRPQFYTSGQNLDIKDIGSFTDGYAVTKFKNLTLAGGPAPSGGNPSFVDTDFPMFRLADAYLMYAEAVLRGGAGGSTAQALIYINNLRQRAYGNTSGNIASNELTLNFILDERARELYWECHRRTDLIRYGVFTGPGYLWGWKGNSKDGTSTSGFRNLFPIPALDLATNPSLKQMVSGY